MPRRLRVFTSSGELADPVVYIGNASPPAAGAGGYPAGGFTVDLTAFFTSIKVVTCEIKTMGNLPGGTQLEITEDSPIAGKFRVKLVRARYDKTDTPTGVNAQDGTGVQTHTHPLTYTATDLAVIEVAAGTDLSTTVIRYIALGN